jgi:uncharacterized damage-inducible protein DinB
MRDELLTGFDYDLWANGRWAEALGRFRDPERARAIFEHIAAAQQRWLARCGVESTAELADLYAAWRDYILTVDLELAIEYRTLDGQPYTNRVHEIARHVINHGTYHRGHLRGLAEAEGLTDFPETDFIGFVRARD